MKNLTRNILIVVNLFLVASFVISLLWLWRINNSCVRIIEKRNKIEQINEIYETYINSRLQAYYYIGMKFPKIVMQDLNGNIISTDFSKLKGGLVLFFSPKSCQPCLTSLLKILNHIKSELKKLEELPIYAISNSSSLPIKKFVRAFELRYPFISDSEGIIFKDSFVPIIPIVFLINKENKIIGCHIPSPGRQEFSILFFNELRFTQIKKHLGIDIDVFSKSFGLKNVSYLDVIKNQYKKEDVKKLLY